MGIEDYIHECGYKEKSTLEDIMNETIHDVLCSIDDSLVCIIEDIKSGNCSNNDIILKINEIRKQIL